MPRKDKIHDAVRNALIKDGWTITDDLFRIVFGDANVYVDLRIERTEAETQVRRALVIEVKGFSGDSPILNLENALGQYELYSIYLSEIAPQDELYLAVSEKAYKKLFARPSFEIVVQKKRLSLLIVNTDREEVVQWIN